MNLFQFMSLFSAGATFFVGVFAFFSHPGRKINQTFLLLCMVIALWQLNVFMGMVSIHTGPLVFWIKQSSAVSAFIPAMMNLARISILFPDKSLWALAGKNKVWLAVSAAVFLICQSSWFLNDATPPTRSQVLPTPHYGEGFILVALYFVVAFASLISLLIQSNRRMTGGGKAEIEYILLSCGTGLFLGVVIFLIPNLTGWNDLGALLPASVITFITIAGYGIATKGILDVPVVARRIIAYALLLLYLSCLYFAVLFTFVYLLVWVNQPPYPLAHLFATLAVAISVSPAQGLAQRLANRLFINTPPLNVGAILRDAGSRLNAVLTVDELCERFHQILGEKLETRDLTILIRQQDRFIQIYPLDGRQGQPVNTPLPEWIGGESRLFVRDLLQRHKPTPGILRTLGEMRRNNAAGVISLERNGKSFGILLLGERASGRLYAQEEAVAVEGLRDLFSVAYENARLYTELRNSRIYMDLLLKNLVNGVIATDTEGRITTCNREAARILDLDPVSLRGHSINRLPAPLCGLLREAFADQHILRDREIILAESSEEPLHLNVGASLFRDHEGGVVGGLLVFQDRTALRKLEDQVRRSERLASLGTLSAGMAHEIKNPLVTLKTFAQLLPERFDDAEFRDTFSTLAEKEIGRIDTLVNQLLSFARPVKPRLEPLSLHETLRSHVKWFRQQAASRDIRVEEDYRAETDVILGDADQLQQVFLNLLLNAQEAIGGGGEIRVETRAGDGEILLEFSDTGSGISPDDLDHVFDPFFTTKSSGTGLGLAVAHQIVKEHRAEVRVRSENGRGSVFELAFPLNPDTPLS